MATVFTRIINGEIPGTFVHRDPECVVFMSINPLAPGHALVVPLAEVEHWIDLSPDLSSHLFAVARRVGRAQQAAFACDRIGMIIAGYEVPHTHLHLIPTTNMDQLNFANAAATIDREVLESTAVAIRNALGQIA